LAAALGEPDEDAHRSENRSELTKRSQAADVDYGHTAQIQAHVGAAVSNQLFGERHQDPATGLGQVPVGVDDPTRNAAGHDGPQLPGVDWKSDRAGPSRCQVETFDHGMPIRIYTRRCTSGGERRTRGGG
jgi:hypothetical protein